MEPAFYDAGLAALAQPDGWTLLSHGNYLAGNGSDGALRAGRGRSNRRRPLHRAQDTTQAALLRASPACATSAPPSSRSRPDEAHAGREQPDEPGGEPEEPDEEQRRAVGDREVADPRGEQQAPAHQAQQALPSRSQPARVRGEGRADRGGAERRQRQRERRRVNLPDELERGRRLGEPAGGEREPDL